MMHRGFLFVSSWAIAALFCYGTASAEAVSSTPKYATADTLEIEVTSFLTTFYSEKLGGEKMRDSVSITVSNLDSRLRLEACDAPLQKKLASPSTQSRHITVRVACDGPKPWSIFVPARIDIYSDVVVLARTVARGTVITEEDIDFARVNVSEAGYGLVEDADRIVGMELKRNLRPGSPIKLSFVKPPQVVKRGDKVTLEAASTGFSVKAPGTAMADGELGEQIRVKNTESNRVVDALVIAPGRVRISLY